MEMITSWEVISSKKYINLYKTRRFTANIMKASDDDDEDDENDLALN